MILDPQASVSLHWTEIWTVNTTNLQFWSNISPQRNWGLVVSKHLLHDSSSSVPMPHAVWLTCLDHLAYLKPDLHSQFIDILPGFLTGVKCVISFQSIQQNSNSPPGTPSQEASLCLCLCLIWGPDCLWLWMLDPSIAKRQFCSVAVQLAGNQAWLTVGVHQKHWTAWAHWLCVQRLWAHHFWCQNGWHWYA